MKIRNCSVHVLSAAAVLLAYGAASPASAQESTAVTTPAAATNPEAKAVLDKARDAYKKVHTYQDKVKLAFEMRAKDAEGNDRNQDDNEELEFVYAGPKKFAITHKDFAVVSDGETQTAHLKLFNQYIQKPATIGLIDEAKFGPIAIFSALHAPASLLLEPAKFEKQFPLFDEVTGVVAEERGGKAGKRVSGKGTLPDMPVEGKIPMTMWFSDETGMVGEVTIDLKPAYTEMMGSEMKLDKAMGTLTFSDVAVDNEISADKYTFKARDEDKKVEKFGPDEGPDPQQALVGKPSPDFKGVDLDDKPLSLSDYKGKILVLDFWATWCGPCMQAIPKIQELSTEFADKGVVVIGMNQDEADVKQKVKDTVAKKNLTFRQFMDPKGDVGSAFKVSGIPCTVIIDGKGIIQLIHVGSTPTMKKELAESLEKLLKGESLVKPEAPKKEEEPKK